MRHLTVGILVAAVSAPAGAGTITATCDAPLLDRWNYPFNFTPGARPSGSVFASIAPPDFDEPDFDNRDGQVLLAFAPGGIPQGLAPCSYEIVSAVVRIMLESDGTFAYDPTPDAFTSFLPPEDPEATADDDAGRAITICGVGYRNEFTDEPFVENSPYAPRGQQIGKSIRNAFPIDTMTGEDISNNIDDRFDPAPLGVGTIPSAAPGTTVAEGADVELHLDGDDPAVQAYVGAGLSDGRLDFMITSLHPTVQQGSGTFPLFYMKENLAVKFAGRLPARLEITVAIAEPAVPGDADGSGVVDVDDLVAVILAWATTGCDPADVDRSGVVDVDDLVTVILNWTN